MIESMHEFVEQAFFHLSNLGKEGRILVLDVVLSLFVPD